MKCSARLTLSNMNKFEAGNGYLPEVDCLGGLSGYIGGVSSKLTSDLEVTDGIGEVVKGVGVDNAPLGDVSVGGLSKTFVSFSSAAAAVEVSMFIKFNKSCAYVSGVSADVSSCSDEPVDNVPDDVSIDNVPTSWFKLDDLSSGVVGIRDDPLSGLLLLNDASFKYGEVLVEDFSVGEVPPALDVSDEKSE